MFVVNVEVYLRRGDRCLLWITPGEAAVNPNCPPWTLRSLSRVFESRTGG